MFLLQAIAFKKTANSDEFEILSAGPSHFGSELISSEQSVEANAVFLEPFRLCSSKSFCLLSSRTSNLTVFLELFYFRSQESRSCQT